MSKDTEGGTDSVQSSQNYVPSDLDESDGLTKPCTDESIPVRAIVAPINVEIVFIVYIIWRGRGIYDIYRAEASTR